MIRQLPIVLGVVALIGFTVAEARMSGRFQGSNMTEEMFAALLDKVPMDIGEWHGTNMPVDDQVKKTSGARGYVSRSYRNSVTDEEVTIWLIVGHSKDVCRHTPDVCYPSSGFQTMSPENARETFVFEGQPHADFYTNKFLKEDETGRQLLRVFWSWYKPADDGAVAWEAPEIVRWRFGNAPSLFKLYFTSSMRDYKETTDESPCMKFAEVFLPIVDKALSTSAQPGATDAPADAAASPANSTDS
jgi:hypothetical protein